jgi:hypothetical protein
MEQMETIKILRPIVSENDHIIMYPVVIKEKTYIFNLKYTNTYPKKINDNIDGLVCMFVPIAICNKMSITSEMPIDIQLYENLMKIPPIYQKYHHMHTFLLNHIEKEELKLELNLPTCKREISSDVCIAPHSLGADSLYAILTKKNDITHLFYLRNIDFSSSIKVHESNLEYVAKKYNKKFIIIESNFESIIKKLKLYGTNYAVFMEDVIYVASVYPFGIGKIIFNGYGIDGGENFPFIIGQSTIINQYLCGNEFIRESVDSARVKKLKYIIENDKILPKIMRTCNAAIAKTNSIKKLDKETNLTYYEGTFNCGKCGKCLKTLSYVHMLGYVNKMKSFPIESKEEFISEFIKNLNYDDSKMDLSSKYYFQVFTNVIYLYKKNGNNLNDVLDYCFAFVDGYNVIKKGNEIIYDARENSVIKNEI